MNLTENRKKLTESIKEVFSGLLVGWNVRASRISTTELVHRCFMFCGIVSGIEQFPYQEQFSKRVIRSVLENDGEEITALFSRQSGKTQAISMTVAGLMILLPQLSNMPMFADDPRLIMFKDGFWIGIFAPSLHQAQITYNRIRGILSSPSAVAVLEDDEFRLAFTTSNGQTVALNNRSFVTSISASDNSNIEGESFKLIICEEAQDISNFKIRKSIHPMGAAYNATIVKIGTATTHKGDFYEAIQRNKYNYEKRIIRLKNHFEYDCKVAAKYNPRYAKYVEKEAKRLGVKSDEYRMAYLLEWIIARGMFIDLAQFEVNNLEYSLERTISDKQATHVLGVDVGGKGDDTIVTNCEVDWSMPVIEESRINEDGEEEAYTAFNSYIVDWLCISNEPSYEEQFSLIMDYQRNYSVSKMVIDATREASLGQRIQANVPYEVELFIFSSKSKSLLYKNLETEIVSMRARVCAGADTQQTREFQEFCKQIGDLQKGYSGANMLVGHADISGAHDDYPDSWALAVWGCSRPITAVIAQSSVNKFIHRTSNEQKMQKGRNRVTARRR